MTNRAVMTLASDDNYYQEVMARRLSQHWHFVYTHDFRVYRNAPNLTWERDEMTTNRLGRIGPDRPAEKPAHTRRIALLGDSLATGYRMRSERTFGQGLEDRLNAERPGDPAWRFELLNFACPGYLLPQTLDTALEDVRPYGADIYLVELSERAVFRQWDDQLVQIVQQGIDPKYEFLRRILLQAGTSRRDLPPTIHTKLAPYRLAVIRGALEALKAHVERQHAVLILMLVPSVEPGDLSRRRLHDAWESFEGLNVPIIDLTDTFDGVVDGRPLLAAADEVSNLDVHPNERGHAMILENLYRKMHSQPGVWSAVAGGRPSTDHVPR